MNNKFIEFPLDNEEPSFKRYIKPFFVSTTMVTNYLYIQFIEDNGYKKDRLWNVNGRFWRNKHKVYCPLYWEKKEGEWQTNYFGDILKISDIYNHPIIHISWYEAYAFCRWCNGRLLKESEWEYLAKKWYGDLKRGNLD